VRHRSVFQLLQRLHRKQTTIDFSSVEKVNAKIPSSLDAVNGELLSFLGVGVEPVSVADGRDLDASGAEITIDHFKLIRGKICQHNL
jgi:hypothetical protein